MLFAAMTTVARPMPQPVEAGLRADVSVACDTVRASWRVDLDVQAAPTATGVERMQVRVTSGETGRNTAEDALARVAAHLLSVGRWAEVHGQRGDKRLDVYGSRQAFEDACAW